MSHLEWPMKADAPLAKRGKASGLNSVEILMHTFFIYSGVGLALTCLMRLPFAACR